MGRSSLDLGESGPRFVQSTILDRFFYRATDTLIVLGLAAFLGHTSICIAPAAWPMTKRSVELTIWAMEVPGPLVVMRVNGVLLRTTVPSPTRSVMARFSVSLTGAGVVQYCHTLSRSWSYDRPRKNVATTSIVQNSEASRN